MQPCTEKQKCFWLGSRIIWENRCFSNWSHSTSAEDIACRKPLRTKCKKKTAHTMAQNLKDLTLPTNMKRSQVNFGSRLFGQMKQNKFGSQGVQQFLALTFTRLQQWLHTANCETGRRGVLTGSFTLNFSTTETNSDYILYVFYYRNWDR